MDILLERILSLIPDRHGADKEFAKSIGYKSGNVIADWKAGRSVSYKGKVEEIAKVYGVSVSWLFGHDDEKERPDLNEEVGPKKAVLLEALADMTEAEQALLLEHIQRIKSLRG